MQNLFLVKSSCCDNWKPHHNFYFVELLHHLSKLVLSLWLSWLLVATYDNLIQEIIFHQW